MTPVAIVAQGLACATGIGLRALLAALDVYKRQVFHSGLAGAAAAPWNCGPFSAAAP